MPRGAHTCACGAFKLVDSTHALVHGKAPHIARHSFDECDPDPLVAHQALHPLAPQPHPDDVTALPKHRRLESRGFVVPVTKGE